MLHELGGEGGRPYGRRQFSIRRRLSRLREDRGRHGQIGEQHVYTPRRPHDCSGQIQFEEWSIISDDVGAELGKNLNMPAP